MKKICLLLVVAVLWILPVTARAFGGHMGGGFHGGFNRGFARQGHFFHNNHFFFHRGFNHLFFDRGSSSGGRRVRIPLSLLWVSLLTRIILTPTMVINHIVKITTC